jgi:hypothetical protein
MSAEAAHTDISVVLAVVVGEERRRYAHSFVAECPDPRRLCVPYRRLHG